ncbi:MAG: exo-beta-N-acetylmuramidase NamZ domain-containing protein [Acidobacteriota bacterium]
MRSVELYQDLNESKLRTLWLGTALRLCVFAGVLASICSAQGLPMAAPQSVGMNAAKLNQIEALVNAEIAAKKLPGAVVIIGHKGKIVYRKAFGNRSLVPTVEKMTVDTIFDVASLTKVVATTTSIMILVEQGKLRLNDTIGKFIPDIEDEHAKRVTIYQLLTHTSGYRPDFDLSEKWTGREGMLAALKKERLRTPPGTKFVYSDIGFIVLGEIFSRVSSGSDSNVDLDTRAISLFSPIGMKDTSFRNLAAQTPSDRIAPTENIKGQNSYLGSKYEGNETSGGTILRGKVHDPTSYRMDGIAGHAGLFSTADDLARFCQMLLNGGIVPPPVGAGSTPSKDGTPYRILSAQTVAAMTRPYVISETGETRGLGWDMNTSFSSNRGELFPLGSFGHTGFTGTSLWIDRVSQTFVVFMSNRVHPDGKGDVTPLRAKVATVAASAVEDTPIEMYRLAESAYQSQVAAQIPKFTEQAEAARNAWNGPQPSTTAQTKTVLNGIDILERDGFKQLAGMRIGLVTNQTGRNLAGKPTIDILKDAKNVNLVALFSPEHGIRGDLDQGTISDSKDEKTGLPIFSLYGETRRPKPEQLKDIDAIVYDIQDVGVRFWTYTATLKNVLEEAAKAGKPVYILDRPNPVRGDIVEGPIADEDKLSFVAAHTTTVRNGMTIGEHGMMMNTERKIGADVRVIKMEGWSRSMWFDETGQMWINPSPNMRSLTEATLYPGIGLFETTNISVGRGTDTPFEVVGAPWINAIELSAYLNGRRLKGVRFVPISYKPDASVYKDEQIGGVNIIVTDRNEFGAVRTGFEIACALQKLYPGKWQAERSVRLVVNKKIVDQIEAGLAPEVIERSWQNDLAAFIQRRSAFLLYK